MKPVEQFIQKTIKKYQPILKLNEITFFIENDNSEYLACKFVYPYVTTKIFYGNDFEKDFTKKDRYGQKELERRIVHEMVHQLTDPFYAKAVSTFTSKNELEDERERLTDRIATIVCSLI